MGLNYGFYAPIANEYGYGLHGYYAFIDPDVAMERATAQAAKIGRVVPARYLYQSHANISDQWDKIISTLDGVDLYDTTEGAVKVVTVVNGEVEVIDAERYAFFRRIRSVNIPDE